MIHIDEAVIKKPVKMMTRGSIFPVSFDELNAQIDFQDLDEEKREGHGYTVK